MTRDNKVCISSIISDLEVTVIIPETDNIILQILQIMGKFVSTTIPLSTESIAKIESKILKPRTGREEYQRNTWIYSISQLKTSTVRRQME